MTATRLLAMAAALLAAGTAAAQDKPRFCPNRPDLGATGCTTPPGELQLEVSGVDWTADVQDGTREDEIGYADTLVRFGVGPRTEVQLEWTPFVTVRTREEGRVSTERGVGDMRVALRQNLSHPDGEGLSIAIEPFARLPTAPSAIGDGDWSAGVQLPVGYQLGGGWSVRFTGEASAQADEDGHGRHFDANGVIGLGYDIADTFEVTGEFYLERDDDPEEPATIAQLAGSVAWKASERRQLDLLVVAGLNHDAPDVRLVLGGAILF